jgi:transposase
VTKPASEEAPVRVTTLLRGLLAVTALLVTAVRFDDGALVVSVRPRWRKPRCSECEQPAPGYDSLPQPRRWRSLPFGWFDVFLEYTMRRVDCPRCGVRVELVPWAAAASRFTRPFEQLVAYLAQMTDKTTITKLLGLSWRAVGTIIERVIDECLQPERLDGLRRVGIDEFSYRKRHNYVTVIFDHDRGQAVWAAEGRGAETLHRFFDELGAERCAQLETITLDMSGGYLSGINDRVPHVQIVFDRFHVQRLASDAVDEVRRESWRELRDTAEGHAVKNSRWALLKNAWNLTRAERQKLSEVQHTNKRLYRAYLLKETLGAALDYRQLWRARQQLDDWLAWASRSRLEPFLRVARTIRGHKEGILAYVQERLTNGVLEGINNRLRMVARRAFGFHSAGALIAMLYLCCGGIQLTPPLPGSTH